MIEVLFAISFLLFFIAAQRVKYIGQKDKLHRHYSATCQSPKILPNEIVIDGREFDLNEVEMDRILLKRFRFYSALDRQRQLLFLKRLGHFMRKKTFIIKDDEGVKEMPVLVSASAVALTFGLKDFRLPFYKYVRIYPEEYVSEDSFKVLAGNVQENVITVAWNHLLKGYKDFSDGINVGLHEMSHALYIQKIVIEKGYANSFLQKYDCLVRECKEAHNMEAEGIKDVFSDYATKDLQEFWAESVELFFEKPHELTNHYPNVYEALKLLLNQDPTNPANPILENRMSLNRKLKRLLNFLELAQFEKIN